MLTAGQPSGIARRRWSVEPAAPAWQRRAGLRWRTVECMGVVLALFIQTGAITVLAFSGPGGYLTDSGRSMLQLLALPGYLVTLILLARRPAQFLAALRGNIWVTLLLSMTVVSVLWSISPSISLRRAIGLVLSLLVAYLIAIRFTPRQFFIMVILLLGACMVLSLAMMVALPGWARMPDSGELRGVFSHKNVLGWNAAIAALAAAAVATDRAAGIRRLAISVFAVSIACLLLSQSSTGLVTAVSTGIFALFYKLLGRTRGLGRVVLILLVVQVVAATVVSMDLLLGVVLEGTDKDASLTGRVPLWMMVDEAISNRLLLGYGFQAFWTDGSGDAWAIWTRLGWMAPHAHNGYRDALLSVGLVGTVLLIIVILRALRDGARLHCRFPAEQWLWINAIICVTLVMNLTESTLLMQNSFQFTIFMTAVLMISCRKQEL
ncbi:O-antigen ligase family protein [Paracoccus sp. S-4012]|uniref:O-antigen ligase family protein n=1 Tax=Paracoccus sp. S-4012 TaxID=2665648 RepID=UPI0012B069F9|nr:O-antigen ligase family protein [Paracoccus sp. S-4012]MRX51828.1 O-antigen ligase family protein [Paracoccus sp. S-4012]